MAFYCLSTSNLCKGSKVKSNLITTFLVRGHSEPIPMKDKGVEPGTPDAVSVWSLGGHAGSGVTAYCHRELGRTSHHEAISASEKMKTSCYLFILLLFWMLIFHLKEMMFMAVFTGQARREHHDKFCECFLMMVIIHQCDMFMWLLCPGLGVTVL